jgi:hypothetical protein
MAIILRVLRSSGRRFALLSASSCRALTTATIVALAPCRAFAIDGNDLLQSCAVPSSPACVSYVGGVADTLRGVPYFAICPPSGAGDERMVEIAIKKLRDHPEMRHYNAAHVVGIAFRAAFPCKVARPRPSSVSRSSLPSRRDASHQ